MSGEAIPTALVARPSALLFRDVDLFANFNCDVLSAIKMFNSIHAKNSKDYVRTPFMRDLMV
jgi:hypothetical protein